MATIEERLAKLEAEVEELKALIVRQNSKQSWIQNISGTFIDDPDFDEIVRLGREARDAERPEDQ